MGWFKRKPNEQRAFDEAVKKRDYETAVSLGKTGAIPESQVKEAENRLLLWQALWNYGLDEKSTALLDRCLQAAAQMEEIPATFDANLRGKIYYGRFLRAIKSEDYDRALEWAKQITDQDKILDLLLGLKIYALQRYTFSRGRDLSQVEKAIEPVQWIPDDAIQGDTVRKLSLTYALQRHDQEAEAIVRHIPAVGNTFAGRVATYRMLAFFKQHSDSSPSEYEKAIDRGEDRHIAMAMYYTSKRDVNAIANQLKIVYPPDVQYSLFGVFAQVLGFWGAREKGVELLRQIDNLERRRIELAYLLSVVDFPAEQANAVFQEATAVGLREYVSPTLELELTRLFSAWIYSGDFETAVNALRQMENARFKEKVAGMVLDDLYRLQTLAPVERDRFSGSNL